MLIDQVLFIFGRFMNGVFYFVCRRVGGTTKYNLNRELFLTCMTRPELW